MKATLELVATSLLPLRWVVLIVFYLVKADCTWMECPWTRCHCIHQWSSPCHRAHPCCRPSLPGITVTAGLFRLSTTFLPEVPPGPATASSPLLKSISHHRIRKTLTSLITWLTVGCCFQQLATLFWHGNNSREWMDSRINRHLFVLMMFIFTEPLFFRQMVSLYYVCDIISYACISPCITLKTRDTSKRQ